MKSNVLFFELALSFYLIATVVGIIWLFRGKKATSKVIFFFAAIGFTLHTINIIVRYIEGGHIPITNLHEASSFLSWCIVVLFFLLEARYKIDLLGAFIMPVVFILMLSSSILPREINPSLNPVLKSYWFGIHTILAFIGDAAFAMAAGIGVMYLIQERYLKSKHPSGLFQRLPSLQILDEINYRLISLGFPLLTLAIITGVIWANTAWGTYWRWDPKEVWSLITWLVYALVLHLRLTIGWRGKKAAGLSILGFILVIFTFFGVNLLLKGLHAFV
ncbi:MAG: c-type cytochrome biogenesis protein CcsB [Thermodesulfovibrionia bacterium]|nr:c-type cytochrome biogenesis protein CcsB [Thermodesulfovibrionia bacterium]